MKNIWSGFEIAVLPFARVNTLGVEVAYSYVPRSKQPVSLGHLDLPSSRDYSRQHAGHRWT